MPRADFFQRLGLFAVERFLDADVCRELRAAVLAGGREAATVAAPGQTFTVDRGRRSVNWVSLDPSMVSLVQDRLLEAKPTVEQHYGLSLAGCEIPQFLAYRAGDHYKAHRDSGKSALSRARRVSAVIFLSDASDIAAPGRYGGGALTFYGLVDNPSGELPGIPLEAEPGLLVTFPSDLLHAVTPVTHGERYTIASWYSDRVPPLDHLDIRSGVAR